MTQSPRSDHVAVLTRVDLRRFARGDHVTMTGEQLSPADVELVKNATQDELREAQAILSRRSQLAAVGGDAPPDDEGRSRGTGHKPEDGATPTDDMQSTSCAVEGSLPISGTTRRTGPETSRKAAESMSGSHLGAMQQEALDALVARGGEGCLDDVVLATGRQKGTTSRRLTDLEEGGLIRRTGRTKRGHMAGREQIVWSVVDGG